MSGRRKGWWHAKRDLTLHPPAPGRDVPPPGGASAVDEDAQRRANRLVIPVLCALLAALVCLPMMCCCGGLVGHRILDRILSPGQPLTAPKHTGMPPPVAPQPRNV